MDWHRSNCRIELKVNAVRVYEHLKSIDVNLFAQKIGWQKVNCIDEVPTSYGHRTVLIVGMKICHGSHLNMVKLSDFVAVFSSKSCQECFWCVWRRFAPSHNSVNKNEDRFYYVQQQSQRWLRAFALST